MAWANSLPTVWQVIIGLVLGLMVAFWLPFLLLICMMFVGLTNGFSEAAEKSSIKKAERARRKQRMSDAFGKTMTYNDFVEDEDYKHALNARAFFDVDKD